MFGLMLLGPCLAQNPYAGQFAPPFSHKVSRASAPVPDATDPGFEPGGIDAMTFFVIQGYGPVGWPPQAPPPGRQMFEAVHMSLIPKGPNRGKVLVWNILPVLCKAPTYDPSLPASIWWGCQAYAIVDFDPSATVRFQNFLLPIERVDPTGASTTYPRATDLFCAGHCWTQYGDLVVTGGTTFSPSPAGYIAPILTYVFNPRRDVGPFPLPGVTAPLYPPPGTAGPVPRGLWMRGPDLVKPRWYPTNTLTKRITRSPFGTSLPPMERVLIAGGSSQYPGPSWMNSPWNNYEAFAVRTEAAPLTGHGLERDSTAPLAFDPGPTEHWDGPGASPPPPAQPPYEDEYLQEYPRMHSLSNGRVFFSGYAPRGASLDQEVPGSWIKMGAQTGPGAPFSSNWPHPRHDGTSVVNHVPGLYDGVMRLGGSQDVPVQFPNGTATAEWSIAGSPWMPLPPMPATDGAPDGTRTHASALTLPTGAVLVLGGQNNNNQPMLSPLIFAEGSWHVDAPNPVYNRRMYHSAAVLLDDGTVAIGGGDVRDYDYEVYRPYYTLLPASHKPVNLTFPVPPFFNPLFDAWQLEYGNRYEIHCDPMSMPEVAVQKVVLIPPGSATHGFDMHHRYVELKTEVNSTNEVHFDMPGLGEEGVAPRGLYRLWLVTNTGAVSDALWVVVR